MVCGEIIGIDHANLIELREWEEEERSEAGQRCRADGLTARISLEALPEHLRN